MPRFFRNGRGGSCVLLSPVGVCGPSLAWTARRSVLRLYLGTVHSALTEHRIPAAGGALYAFCKTGDVLLIAYRVYPIRRRQCLHNRLRTHSIAFKRRARPIVSGCYMPRRRSNHRSIWRAASP